MTHNPHYDLYISSCVRDGGIFRAEFSHDGLICLKEKKALDRPMYTAVDNDMLYVVLRAPFENSDESGITHLRLSDGALAEQGEIHSTRGVVACHLSVSDGAVYAANYISGSVIRLPDRLSVHTGGSIHPTRQDKAHAHFISPSPDGKYLLAVDLGADKIITYDRELNIVRETRVKAGSGPRHLAFSADGAYVLCVNELSSSLTVYAYDDGRLRFIDEKSTLPKDFSGMSTAAAVRCEKNKAWASNRGHDSVAEFTFSGDGLEQSAIIDVYGSSPRDFVVLDDFLISANELSDTVTVIDIKTKKLLQRVEIDSPLCISVKKR